MRFDDLARNWRCERETIQGRPGNSLGTHQAAENKTACQWQDFAILKNIRLHGERQHLQFRAEMFNLMNRVQFAMPAYLSVVDTGVAGWRLQPRFGEITSQNNSPRYMQMSLRYFF